MSDRLDCRSVLRILQTVAAHHEGQMPLRLESASSTALGARACRVESLSPTRHDGAAVCLDLGRAVDAGRGERWSPVPAKVRRGLADEVVVPQATCKMDAWSVPECQKQMPMHRCGMFDVKKDIGLIREGQ